MRSMIFLAAACSLVLLSACKSDTVAPTHAPVITSFTPDSGVIGTNITLKGANFSSDIAGNVVQFNGVTASITAASATQLTVIVPPNAGTGKIKVTVAALSGSSATDFKVVAPPPVVTSFTPVLGLPGDTITITGTGFSTVMGQNTVNFSNNAAATVISATATQLKVLVPPGAVTGYLSVTVGGPAATSSATLEILKDIPRDSLTAFYPFDANGKDWSGHGFDLPSSINVTSTTDRFGLTGKAYAFAGGNSQWYTTNNTYASVAQPLTIGAWIKYDSLISSEIVGKYSLSPGGYIFGVGGAGAAGGTIYLTINGGVYNQTSSFVLPSKTNGQWIFIAATYDGSTIKFYKNGSPAGSVAVTGAITATTNSNMRIGLDGYGGTTGPQAFLCSIDDVTIYKRVLSDAEVQQLYTATVSKK